MRSGLGRPNGSPIEMTKQRGKESKSDVLKGGDLLIENTASGTGTLDHDRFFSLSLDMLCIADVRGYFKDLNPAWERVLGWTHEELLASPFIEFVHPEDRPATLAETAKLATGADTVWFENRYRCKDDSYRWFAWRATASVEDQLIYAIAIDVTDQKDSEARLVNLLDRERRLSSDLRLLLESTGEGIYGVDIDGRCTFVNRAAAEMLGYSESQVVGSNFHLLAHHSRPDGSVYLIEDCPILRAIRTGEPCRVDDEVLWRSDRSSFFVEYASFPFSEVGIIRGAVVTFRDITERKVAEGAILAERNRLAATLASMAEGAVITDLEGQIVSVNPAMERLGGWLVDEVQGRPFADVYPAFDEKGQLIPADRRLLSKAIQSRQAVTSRGYSIAFLTRDGSRFPVSVSAAPILDADGEVVGAVSVIRDVSFEKEVDQLKSALISTVSHELRTPLTMIQGFSELLLTRDLREQKSREALEQIKVSAERLSRLIENLLSVSRIESDRLAMRLVPVDLPGLVEEVVAAFRQEQDLDLQLSFDQMPLVLADRDMLVQILTNLLSNAIKYSPKGGLVVISGKRQGPSAEISVQDQGIGMSESEAAQLFEKFYRVDHPEVHKVGGTGLGLYITKNLVELQGGQIWVNSEPGRGTTFVFSLPLAIDGEVKP